MYRLSHCSFFRLIIKIIITIEEHSIEVPLSRLTLILTFDLMFIGGRGIVMDYPCGKFGDFSFSRFGFIVRSESLTE